MKHISAATVAPLVCILHSLLALWSLAIQNHGIALLNIVVACCAQGLAIVILCRRLQRLKLVLGKRSDEALSAALIDRKDQT